MDNTQFLNEGYRLWNDTYQIVRVLGCGGFGVTYLALDIRLNKYVAIKEFFPKAYCAREGHSGAVSVVSMGSRELIERYKEKFIKEARNIAKLRHPNIIGIQAAFQENNTAYYVMDFIEGHNFAEVVKDGGPLPIDVATRYVKQIGEALQYLHSIPMNHLDVKPANIMLKNDGSVLLIDFGLAKRYDSSGNQTSTTPVGISHGYAPMEQYGGEGVSEFSPATDLYSLAATYYFLLTGNTPPSAPSLPEVGLKFPANIPLHIQRAINRAMSPFRRSRHQSVKEFIAEITSPSINDNKSNTLLSEDTDFQQTALPSPDSSKSPAQPKVIRQDSSVESSATPTSKRTKSRLSLPIIICVITVILLGIWTIIMANNNGKQNVVVYNQNENGEIVDTPLNEAQTQALAEQSKADLPDAQPAVPINYVNGHESVDLGLSVNWATCNLGADSPSDYGDYYVWGMTNPGFQRTYSTSGTSICGNPTADAATAAWGDRWRMPTANECKELLNKCTWRWTTLNGVAGYRIEGRNGNSIFLPAAGYIKDYNYEYVGTNGNYWSGTPKDGKAYYISYQKTDYRECRLFDKDRARSIRPVVSH